MCLGKQCRVFRMLAAQRKTFNVRRKRVLYGPVKDLMTTPQMLLRVVEILLRERHKIYPEPDSSAWALRRGVLPICMVLPASLIRMRRNGL